MRTSQTRIFQIDPVPRPGSRVVRESGVLALLAGFILALPSGLAGQEQDVASAPDGEETPAAEHRVEGGDTLWDMADHYLANPFSWEEIFDLNRSEIEDPHWIYPGQQFRLPAGASGGRMAAADGRYGSPEGSGRPEVRTRMMAGSSAETSDGASSATGSDPFAGPSVFSSAPDRGVTLSNLSIEEQRSPLLVSPSDHYGAGFLAFRREFDTAPTTRRVLRENPLGLDIPPSARLNDRVVVDLNGEDVSEGDVLQAIRPSRSLGGHGTVIRSMALLQVTEREGDSARAVVRQLFGSYQAGDRLIPARPFRFESRDSEPVAGDLSARLIGFETEQEIVTLGQRVFLDVGERDGVELGDEFQVGSEREGSGSAARSEDRLSVVRVVHVRPNSATARVVEIRDVGTAPGTTAVRFRRAVSPGG